MARHKVEICGVNTANIKVLSHKEMNELMHKYKNGDKTVKEELINGNLKLVLSILKNYTNRCDNMDDLFQVGCVGLIKAIDNFDMSHNVLFSTYAVPMILGEIRRYLRDFTSIRIARSIKDTAYKASKIEEELIKSLGRNPTIKEIAEKLNMSEYEVGLAIDSTKETLSMFEPIYNDGGDTIYLQDQLNEKENIDINTKIALKNAINSLKEKERYILLSRYFIGKTQLDLAESLGISQAQISRLEKRGLDKIKKMIE